MKELLKRFIHDQASTFVTNAKVMAFWTSQNKEVGCFLNRKFMPESYYNCIGIPLGSPYKNVLNYQIHKMVESGVIDLWKQKWLERHDTSEEYVCSSVLMEEPSSLAFEHIILAVQAIGIGILSSIFIAVFEKLFVVARKSGQKRNLML